MGPSFMEIRFIGFGRQIYTILVSLRHPFPALVSCSVYSSVSCSVSCMSPRHPFPAVVSSSVSCINLAAACRLVPGRLPVRRCRVVWQSVGTGWFSGQQTPGRLPFGGGPVSASILASRCAGTGAVPTAPAAAEPSPDPLPNGCTIGDRFCCPWHRGEMPIRGKSRSHSSWQREEMPARGKSRSHSSWQREEMPTRGKSMPHSPWQREEMPTRGKEASFCPWQRGSRVARGGDRAVRPWRRQKVCCPQRWETRRPR